jgi:thiol-disulfide isomerase/thioredoxin
MTARPSRPLLHALFTTLAGASIATALNVGDAAPPFDLAEADGGQVSLAANAGKVILLNFWASWCDPCKEEMPHIQEDIQDVYGPDLFTAISLNKFDNLTVIGLYKHGLLGVDFTYPFGYDEGGDVSDDYDAGSVLPHNFIIDQQGVVQYVEAGFTETAIIAKIEELLSVDVQSLSWSDLKRSRDR